MGDSKISELPSITFPIVDTDVVPIVQAGVSRKMSVLELRNRAQRRHAVVGSTVYEATASEGVAESTATWSISKIVVASNGTVTVTRATDAWTNRLTATYA